MKVFCGICKAYMGELGEEDRRTGGEEMPTGYTAELMEKGESFQKFTIRCARNFGALIMMRDEPMDAPIPEMFKPSDYHVKALAEARQKHDILLNMPDDAKIIFGQKEKDARINQLTEWMATQTKENARLSEMRCQVEAWHTPTKDHDGLREFMLDQIRISKNDTAYLENQISQEQSKPPLAFYVAAVSGAAWSLQYHAKEYSKEEERAKNRTEWVNQLRKSIGV